MSLKAVIFGPQASEGLGNPALGEIRSAMRELSHLQPLMEAVRNLPTLFKSLVNHNPSLEQTPGGWSAIQMVRWMNQEFDDISAHTKCSWNSIAAPISVLVNIVQYSQYLHNSGTAHGQVLDQIKEGGCQGFCLGLLSAAATAISTDEKALALNGAAAIQLAFCMGVYADFDQISLKSGSTTAFVLRRQGGSELDMSRVRSMLSEIDVSLPHIIRLVLQSVNLRKQTKPYIATRIDRESCTVVMPNASAAQIQRYIPPDMYTLRPLNLQARYHSQAMSQRRDCLLRFYNKEQALRFPGSTQLLAPVYSNSDGSVLGDQPIHELILGCIMTKMADWHLVVSKMAKKLSVLPEPSKVLELGIVRSLASSRLPGLTAIRPSFGLSTHSGSTSSQPTTRTFPDIAVAIVGMGCRFPGAESLEDLWGIINSGQSLCQEIPMERFDTNDLRRTPKVKRFFANLIDDVESFDHRMFQKTSREAASMDPQQRLLLQVAYHTLESANYFNGPMPLNKDIGCYIGVCANDYADNVASHPPNAFSTLGTLRAFLAGRISHYFGWTGESSTIDTACSSSAVAINKACTDIIAGKCKAALAGGANIFTSPNYFQNLHAGKFLSPTGQCKSFDASADGYCRGEGVGLVMLKKLSEAQAAGDEILAVIPGSAVRQNSNETYITVPHGPSQSDLYEEVLKYSKMAPEDVTYVEAHGTGTPVGDPIEFESIRRVFGGQQLQRNRQNLLHVGSIKANIGHTESASGVAAVIKAVLMIHHKRIPPQANFVSLNPQIKLSESDGMAITKTGMEWKSSGPLTVCVNNYGASGSNAALIVTEPPPRSTRIVHSSGEAVSQAVSFPFRMTAFSQDSLAANISALRKYIDEKSAVEKGNIAYNLASKQNLSLPFATLFTATSVQQLRETLHTHDSSNVLRLPLPEKARPIIMAFGGQTSKSVALDESLYRSCGLLRFHLDQCQRELKQLGFPGIFPQIFQAEPIEDPVILHSALFSLQYSFAKSWIDSGITIARVVGHSFGELTAMCVSGILSLSDGLNLAAGRARLMSEKWGPETGSMLMVEADTEILSEVFSALNVEVACRNAPQLTVISGSLSEIEQAQNLIKQNPKLSHCKTRILNVPYAFHSRFTEPILDDLESLAASLTFREPTIPFETCLDEATQDLPWAQRIREHTRRPVFFTQAVQRLHGKLNGCFWLEAGANSGITTMARRALGEKASEHSFSGLSSREGAALRDSLAQATLDLWADSHSVTFWEFHPSQKGSYSCLPLLPPYQFERSRHWLEWTDSGVGQETQSSNLDTSSSENSRRLLTLKTQTEKSLEFIVDPEHETWKRLVQGHAVVGQPLCPAPMFMELASEAALKALGYDVKPETLSVTWRNLQMDEALGASTDCLIHLFLQQIESSRSWSFSFVSWPRKDPGAKPVKHASGEVRLLAAEDAKETPRFAHYETALRHTIPQIQTADASETVGLRGPLVYSVFSRVVTYDNDYKGIWDVVAKGSEAIGRVRLSSDSQVQGFENMITNPLAMDNFVQVSGIHVNSLSGMCSDNEVFVCTRIGKVEIGPEFSTASNRRWTVLSMYRDCDGKNIDNDIYVYDDATERIVVTIHGARFSRVLIKSLNRALASRNGEVRSNTNQKPPTPEPASPRIKPQHQSFSAAKPPQAPNVDSVREDEVFALLARVAEIDLSALSNDASLADLGIDSLLSTEVLTEVNEKFSIELSDTEYQNMVFVRDLVQGIRRHRPSKDISGTLPSPPLSDSGSCSEPDDQKSTSASTPTSVSGDAAAGLCITSNPHAHHGKTAIQLHDAYETFQHVKAASDEYTNSYGAPGFWGEVYPYQAALVVQYVVEAFPQLGCDLSTFKEGDELPPIEYSQKNALLALQLFEILADASLIRRRGKTWVRTNKPLPSKPSSEQLQQILKLFPRHASEHKLLDVTAKPLADCMTGAADPLTLVFRNKENATLLEDVYTNAPFYLAAGKQLCSFVEGTLSKTAAKASGEPIQILEIGGGTASTTKHVLRTLCDAGIPFVYTFTDVAAALVGRAKQKLPGFLSSASGKLEFRTLNVTKEPAPELLNKFHLVISTNCVHATADLTTSLTNIKKMLVADGMVSLVEFTKNLFWFDLVFGLMDGWWSMTDGREHVLADEYFWQKSFQNAGFEHVDWTGGDQAESNMLRIITGFKTCSKPKPVVSGKRFEVETIMFKQTGENRLFADVYLPPANHSTSKVWSVALLFHGGGYITLSRRDINLKYIQQLHDDGILPISVDYRLCPESNILEGAMADACSALEWARQELPSIKLGRPDLKIGPKVFAIGWSSGGHLAMTLAWTALEQRLFPPQAILAFYCPSFLESESWTKPNFPSDTHGLANEPYDLFEGVQNYPITEYRAKKSNQPVMPGKWLAPNDPRSRIILHGNWKGQLLPLWLNGVPKSQGISQSKKDYEAMEIPSPERVASISPHAQVLKGTYRTPTFMIHGTEDDLIPFQQTQAMSELLVRNGIESELALVENGQHLLDLQDDPEKKIEKEIGKGFAFLRRFL
ncbi:polyketide synthase [Colletotrichum truncatum]|uniref:Polyketide synthase n=1 Tax=Colletotrichum truncatum TaxID=5467 RepID=A0ACC3Z266_COLTU